MDVVGSGAGVWSRSFRTVGGRGTLEVACTFAIVELMVMRTFAIKKDVNLISGESNQRFELTAE
jgi:hypothetical protein